MIPNGKQMDWNGHNLTFESEHDRCSGCFFANKNECPDCDEGIWVEENPSPWHTGTPTEEGWYLVAFNLREEKVRYECWYYPNKVLWDNPYFEVLGWMPIPPYEEKEE